MGGVSKTLALAVTAASAAVIMALLFAWVGPGFATIPGPASAAILFDEQQVQQIYDRVSPAVVEIIIDNAVGDSFAQTGFGSGFLIDQEGHIATNNHVIEGNDRVRIKFLDGSYATTKVLGRNPANDVALLKVDPSVVANIEPIVLGDSSMVRPGQLAIAMGSPFQMEGTVTAGIISGVNRALPSDLGRSISGVIQTDALIAPGNSGGPLLNSAGQVVGINTAIQVPLTGTRQRGAGFAVPINALRQNLPQLKQSQVVQPPWLGVSIIDLNPVLAEHLDLPTAEGVYVSEVTVESPAQAAGLVPSGIELDPEVNASPSGPRGDVIVGVDGVSVNTGTGLIAELNRRQSGDSVVLTVIRGGETIEVPVTLATWPEDAESNVTRQFFHREIPDWRDPSILPEFPRDLPIPRFHYDFEIPGFSLPDLTPALP